MSENKLIEDIRFFEDNLGVHNYPVIDESGAILGNARALIGLYSQTELELCANYLKGKIMVFEQTADGKFMKIEENKIVRNTSLNIHHGLHARGVLVELKAA